MSAIPSPPRPSLAGAVARSGRSLMLLSVTFFTANALLVRLLSTRFGVDSWVLSSARFVVGFVLVAVPLLPGGRMSFRALIRNPLLVARGVVGGLGVYIYYLNVAQLGVGRATFINNTYIAMGAVLATVFLRERLRPAVIAALALALLGVALLTGISVDVWNLSPADALALLGALCAAVVIVIIRKLHERENTSTIFAAQCAWGFVFAVGPTVHGWVAPVALAVALLALSGVLAAVGQLTMTAAYKLLPVAEGSLFQTLLPVGIAIGGLVFFDERHSWREAAGAALIIVSCLVAGRTRPRLAAGLSPAWQRGSPRPPAAP